MCVSRCQSGAAAAARSCIAATAVAGTRASCVVLLAASPPPGGTLSRALRGALGTCSKVDNVDDRLLRFEISSRSDVCCDSKLSAGAAAEDGIVALLATFRGTNFRQSKQAENIKLIAVPGTIISNIKKCAHTFHRAVLKFSLSNAPSSYRTMTSPGVALHRLPTTTPL